MDWGSLSNEEIIERLQETVALVDKLQERDLLERRLQEVRDLEERLQDVDELAEMLQDVIEEELGKEEVEQFRREEEIKVQAETFVDMVVKKSAQRFESKEEEEVDELEEQIKEVFLKGLIPEEEKEEVEVKRVRFVVEEDGMQLRAGSREKLRQTEEEWKKELEEKSGSTTVTTFAVAYSLEEHTARKSVTDVKEREWRQDEKEEVRRLEEPEEQSRLGDTDVWFKVFDRPSLTEATGPPGTYILALNLPA